ncbi:MAG: hypothetical protein ACRELD_12380 [Longimicrobiales bacterium]
MARRPRSPCPARAIALVAAFGLNAANASAQQSADAYMDATARVLVERARARRAERDDAITGYRTIAREHISVGLRALRRDRLLFRRETASRIEWRQDDVIDIEVLGARQAVPIALRGVQVPDDLDAGFGHLAFDPAEPRLLVGLDEGGSFARHPFAEESEADYRFESGDTVVIRLPSGRALQLIELIVHPRRADFEYVIGSFWLDADSYDVVRATYRPARVFDAERDLPRIDSTEVHELDGVPGILKPLRAEIRYITLEYGLWELQWWLPRTLAIEAVASAGSLLRTPVVYERTYGDYEVMAGRPGDSIAAELEARAAAAELAAEVALAARDIAADTTRLRIERDFADLLAEDWKDSRCRARPGVRATREAGVCRYFRVTVAVDTATLLAGDWLPGSIFRESDRLMSDSELEDLAEQLGGLPAPQWQPERAVVRYAWQEPDLLRYNRVEGLSAGARVRWDLGPARVDATARLGIADLEPNANLGIERDTRFGPLRFASYRGLTVAQDELDALGLGNSLSALLFGNDEGDYYRATGVELVGLPRPMLGERFQWRLFAEHHTPVRAHTDFSLRHALDSSRGFRPNLLAVRADQVGIAARLRVDRGLDATGWRGGVIGRLEAATGSYAYARPAVGVFAGLPLPFGVLAALEAEAGSSTGRLPPQRLWFLGGPATLRGYGGSAASGTAFWRARAELANAFPAARLALFTDLGWAGERAGFLRGSALNAVGIGASVLDGVLRFDLARALDPPRGWRASLYLDAIL